MEGGLWRWGGQCGVGLREWGMGSPGPLGQQTANVAAHKPPSYAAVQGSGSLLAVWLWAPCVAYKTSYRNCSVSGDAQLDSGHWAGIFRLFWAHGTPAPTSFESAHIPCMQTSLEKTTARSCVYSLPPHTDLQEAWLLPHLLVTVPRCPPGTIIPPRRPSPTPPGSRGCGAGIRQVSYA